MLNRRHIRRKEMQCIYAQVQSKDESLVKQEKVLRMSIENMYVLYLLILSLWTEIHKLAERHVGHSAKKYLATEEDNYPDREKFIKNRLLRQLADNGILKGELSKRKLDNWYMNEEYVKIIFREIVASEAYREYMAKPGSSYAGDRDLIIQLFREIVAPNEKIYEYIEDDKLTWVDDFPIVNTFLLKRLKKATETSGDR